MALATQGLDIEPLSPVLGARIKNVDLSKPVSDETADAIRAAFLKYHVLCFPGQDLSIEDQARFAAMFGEADRGEGARQVKNEGRDRERGIMLITNIRENGQPIGALPDGEMHFHSDGAHRDVPYRATTLYARKIPSRGGETKFADMTKAYEALSDEMKQKLEGLEARYFYDVYATLRHQTKDDDDSLSNSAHPLVKVHPETGRKTLYLSRLMARYIVGMDRDESEKLLLELFDHCEQPQFVYAHEWAVDDLLIWDNRCLNHARNNFPAEEVRLMRRLTVSEPA
ncbi:MAG: hypothetical protein RLZ98_3344 [Pseudomonadota bacterium]|jgi:taurine dioxygenase